jgi:phage/conjugal plasmid C-4 type zinc finger TraR family protein
MDEFDRASELEQRWRDAAIRQAQAAKPQGLSAHECEDCAEPIPQARREAVSGCRFCIECQIRHEKRSKIHRFPGSAS